MSVLDVACVACASAWPVALLAVILFVGLAYGTDRGEASTKAGGLLIIVIVLAAGSCAAEDRVCEMSERAGTVQP